jgi:asparagine synthase (glutamine-hydrolysing)
MCGIAGVVGTEDPDRRKLCAERMAASLARRGPDAEGVACWPRATLSHRRLAVFDVSPAGNQPMLSRDGKIGVVFNGAIYNFRDLRRELEGLGYVFCSQTDTEVLVAGYQAWGLDSLISKLHGMFAFGLWDDRAQKLFLVRDRLGVKPLFYAVKGGELAFASTAAALAVGGYATDIDPEGILDFLKFGFVTETRSIYRGIAKLPPAQVLEWSDQGIKLYEYWRPPWPGSADSPTGLSFSEAVSEVERLLLRAVEIRLQADVPVGALLSGGIDSALVCWALREVGSNITAYTISTPGDPWDEADAAKSTAIRLGLRHRVLVATADTSPTVKDLVDAYSEPFACASALGMLRVSETVREQAKVLLTGDGGDDLFLGYLVHPKLLAAQRVARWLPNWSTSLWKRWRPRVGEPTVVRQLVHFFDYATGGLGAVIDVAPGLKWYIDHKVLGERLASVGCQQSSPPHTMASARRVLEDFLEYHRHTVFVGEYLTKVDGATMYHGLEARSPFLDQDLWIFASALPYELRLKGWMKKAMLRHIAARRIGPDIAARPKRGFGIPVQRWLSSSWRSELREAFSSSVLSDEGWVQTKPILPLVDSATPNQPVPHQLWYLYVLESWIRHTRELRRGLAVSAR